MTNEEFPFIVSDNLAQEHVGDIKRVFVGVPELREPTEADLRLHALNFVKAFEREIFPFQIGEDSPVDVEKIFHVAEKFKAYIEDGTIDAED